MDGRREKSRAISMASAGMVCREVLAGVGSWKQRRLRTGQVNPAEQAFSSERSMIHRGICPLETISYEPTA